MGKVQWHFKSSICWWNCKSEGLSFFTFSISVLPFLKCHCTFYMYGPLIKKSMFRFLKDCVLAVLSSKMLRPCPSNVLQDVLGDNSINRALKNLNVLFWPIVCRYKKCSDISDVTSGGRAEINNVKNYRPSDFHFQLCQQRSLLNCHCSFYIYGQWDQKVCTHLLKEGVLVVLLARMSRSCWFWLF